MKNVLCSLLLLVCVHLCFGESQYEGKPVLFINLTVAGGENVIPDGCNLPISGVHVNEGSLMFKTATGGDDICAASVSDVLTSANASTAENIYQIGASSNVTSVLLQEHCKEGVLKHNRGLLHYHCQKPEISFFFDRFTWWALMIVVILAVAIVAGSVVACYIDCINRRTSMPESVKDDAERSSRDEASTIRRVQLEKLLEASILRHRMREAEAEKAKSAAEYRRAKRAERRKRMAQAQQEVSERSTESQASSEVLPDGEPKPRWAKPVTAECVPLTSLNPEIIHRVVDERATDNKVMEGSKQDSTNNTDSVEMKPQKSKKEAQAIERDKDEPKTGIASNPEAPRLPISKIAPPSKNRPEDQKTDKNDHLIDSIELTKDTRPEVAVSKTSSETNDGDDDADSMLRTCEEDLIIPPSQRSSPEQS